MKRGNCATVSARFAQTVVTFAGTNATVTARFAAPVAMTTAAHLTGVMMIAGAATATIDAGEARAVIRSSETAAADATVNSLRFKPETFCKSSCQLNWRGLFSRSAQVEVA